MDRRKSLKILTWGTLGAGVFIEACKNADKKATLDKAATGDPNTSFNRMPEEEVAYKKLHQRNFLLMMKWQLLPY